MAKLQNDYKECKKNSQIINLTISNYDKINILRKNSIELIESIKDINNKYVVKTLILYSAIHQLSEAIAERDLVKTLNHKCLFTYICYKYKLNYNTINKLRLIRNKINYEGKTITKNDFKENEAKLKKIYNKLLSHL